ncbi:MAG TPA: hypothetical protein VJA94_25835 [Candidatus Angelobacter sp.]
MFGTVVERVPDKKIIPREDLLALAQFENHGGRAISFYFSSTAFSDRAHLEQFIALKKLGQSVVRSHFGKNPPPATVASDLLAVFERASQMQRSSLGFKAIFACGEQDLWQEFELPLRMDVRFLQLGRRFYLKPLLRAIESCCPYCVVLLEHGKARGFLVRGTLIQEIEGYFSKQGARLHVDDSRVGWSHHVEGEARQHAQAYLRGISREIQDFLTLLRCGDLLIGCREDLWGEIRSYLSKDVTGAVRGHFHLPTFDASPEHVLQTAQPVFSLYREEQHAGWLNVVRERSRGSAEGIAAVVQELEEGRVHTLLLDSSVNTQMLECLSCGHATATTMHICPHCSTTDFAAVDAHEVLIRKALLTGSDVLTIDGLEASATGGVAALLRY